MISQPSPMRESRSVSVRPALGGYLLRALLVLSLIYYALRVADLLLHPMAPGVFLLGSGGFRFLIVLVISPGTIVVGAFIMRRVPGNTIGPLLIIYGVGIAGWSLRADWGSPELTAITRIISEIYTNGVADAALFILFLSFPSGQVYPRWASRWVRLCAILYVIGVILELMTQSPGPATAFSEADLPVNPLFVPALAPYHTLIAATIGAQSILSLLAIVAMVVSLILRYRAAQTRERQQIKWVVWVTGVFLALTIVFFAATLHPNYAALDSPLGKTLRSLYYSAFNAFSAVAIGIAILRNRLWDIDIIINRTLVYGTLTAILALLYFGLIFALQSLLQMSINQNNDVAIVVSTLVIAALFQPLRHRLQRFIDRRFYRSKYDAAKTLEAFSATLRNEVDLNQLREHLLNVVQETIQPAHVSLWLRSPQPTAKQQGVNTSNLQENEEQAKT